MHTYLCEDANRLRGKSSGKLWASRFCSASVSVVNCRFPMNQNNCKDSSLSANCQCLFQNGYKKYRLMITGSTRPHGISCLLALSPRLYTPTWHRMPPRLESFLLDSFTTVVGLTWEASSLGDVIGIRQPYAAHTRQCRSLSSSSLPTAGLGRDTQRCI